MVKKVIKTLFHIEIIAHNRNDNEDIVKDSIKKPNKN